MKKYEKLLETMQRNVNFLRCNLVQIPNQNSRHHLSHTCNLRYHLSNTRNFRYHLSQALACKSRSCARSCNAFQATSSRNNISTLLKFEINGLSKRGEVLATSLDFVKNDELHSVNNMELEIIIHNHADLCTNNPYDIIIGTTPWRCNVPFGDLLRIAEQIEQEKNATRKQ